MTRWNNAVKQSASSGGLRQFSEAVQRISGKGLELLHGAFIRVRDLITTSAPTIEKILTHSLSPSTSGHLTLLRVTVLLRVLLRLSKACSLSGQIGWLTAFIAIQR